MGGSAEAVSLANHTAPTLARALMTNIFTKCGAPKQLLTDRGPEFESELFAELMKWMKKDKIRTSPYEASTNGAVERFHVNDLKLLKGFPVSGDKRYICYHLDCYDK